MVLTTPLKLASLKRTAAGQVHITCHSPQARVQRGFSQDPLFLDELYSQNDYRTRAWKYSAINC